MKIALTEFVTLDGVCQGPGSGTDDTSDGFTRGGWLVPHIDGQFVRRASAWLDLADGLLLGRRTYEAFARDWPQITDPDDPFTERMNSLPKYVVSGTLGEAELAAWDNTTLIPAGEAVARIRDLRAADGGDLAMMGSPTLVRTLLAEGLVDELQLVRMPVILGGGKSIFPEDGMKRPLEHVSTVTAKTGADVSVYRPAP